LNDEPEQEVNDAPSLEHSTVHVEGIPVMVLVTSDVAGAPGHTFNGTIFPSISHVL
jgi:hypothetical protein